MRRPVLIKLLTMSLDDIPPLIENGLLPSHQYLKAVSLLRDGDFWKDWAVFALLVIAVGHILSGIIFFFAFNWNDLNGMTKFTIVGGGIVTCLMAWIFVKLDSPAGHAFGIASTVLVGVMYAVLGQVYQTPAMIHTPFVFWAILTFPFAMASRNLAHWTVWFVILIVAIMTYSNSWLRLADDHFAANMVNIIVSGGLILALIILDKILAPHLVWARAEWFRVLLVLAIISFAFISFTESFWNIGNWLWPLALGLICGLLAYLYYFKPSLGPLALASFSVFISVAQFGLKPFEKIDSTTSLVGFLFLLSLWMVGLSFGLIKAFHHFSAVSKSQHNITVLKDDNRNVSFMVSLTDFCEQIGLEESGVSNVLTSKMTRNNRWYMELFLAVSGILTAIFASTFFASIIFISMGISDLVFLGLPGILVFGLSIFMRRKAQTSYLKHMLNTMIIVGIFLTSFGFGAELNNFESSIALPFLLSLIVLILVRDRILEFLSAGVIISLISAELFYLKVPIIESIILVLATVLGVILLTHPFAQRLYQAAGTAFLLTPPILGIALIHTQVWEGIANVLHYSDDWMTRLISFIVLLSSVVYLNKGKTIAEFKPPKAILFPLLIGATVVPFGGASTLLVILTGYILGSRTLSTVGMLLQIYFLTMLYYDLSLSLLTKSIILFLSGLLFLGIWSFVRQKGEIHV